MRSIARGVRWVLASLLLLVGLAAFQRGWIDSCTTTVTERSGGQEVATVCAPVAINSGLVLSGVLLFLVLVWPDLAEVGAFGVTMKRRVAAAEDKAESAAIEVATLGNRIEVQALRVDNAVSSASTASASATVPIMIGGLELNKAAQGLGGKIEAFKSGQSHVPQATREPTAEQNALRVELLENAEWLREAFPSVYRSRNLPPDPRRVPDADEKGRVGRFLHVFGEELEIVRAARNAVAHAQPLSDDELEKAVDISRRLRDIEQQTHSE